jgi:hypothetical protein
MASSAAAATTPPRAPRRIVRRYYAPLPAHFLLGKHEDLVGALTHADNGDLRLFMRKRAVRTLERFTARVVFGPRRHAHTDDGTAIFNADQCELFWSHMPVGAIPESAVALLWCYGNTQLWAFHIAALMEWLFNKQCEAFREGYDLTDEAVAMMNPVDQEFTITPDIARDLITCARAYAKASAKHSSIAADLDCFMKRNYRGRHYPRRGVLRDIREAMVREEGAEVLTWLMQGVFDEHDGTDEAGDAAQDEGSYDMDWEEYTTNDGGVGGDDYDEYWASESAGAGDNNPPQRRRQRHGNDVAEQRTSSSASSSSWLHMSRLLLRALIAAFPNHSF